MNRESKNKGGNSKQRGEKGDVMSRDGKMK